MGRGGAYIILCDMKCQLITLPKIEVYLLWIERNIQTIETTYCSYIASSVAS